MSTQLKHFIGIDISKLFFDVALLRSEQPGCILHEQFKQTPHGFTQLRQWLEEKDVFLNEETLVCMEYTGIYNTALVNYLCKEKALVWIEMALRIKKSQGFERSSDDKTDAIKIARYAYRHQDSKQLWSPTDKSLSKIKHLIAQRDRLIDSITRLTVSLNELKEIGCKDEAMQMEKLQKPVINSLKKARHKIEGVIMSIVNDNKELLHKVNTIKSIKGIGEVTAVTFLVYTKGFTCFENAKELACYCGVAPFIKKQSGVSIRSKPGVSPFANKKLKWLLHLCALSAVRCTIVLICVAIFSDESYGKNLFFMERRILDDKGSLNFCRSVFNCHYY